MSHSTPSTTRNKTGSTRLHVTLWRRRATIVTAEKQQVLHISVCVCSPRYPACNAYAPCYIIACGLCGSTIFFRIIC